MLPFVNIFGKDIAMYGVLIFIGFIIGILFALFYFSKFYDIKKEDILYSILFGIIGMGIGAKLLYIVVSVPEIAESVKSIGWQDTLILTLKGRLCFLWRSHWRNFRYIYLF